MTPEELRTRNFVTVRQAATILGTDEDGPLDERTVRRAIEAEQLPAVRVGTKTLIPARQLADLIDPRAEESPTENGIDREAARAAADMIRAGIAALDALIDASGIARSITSAELKGLPSISAAHKASESDMRGARQSSLTGDGAA